MNCVDCRFPIEREKVDGSIERFCRLDGRLTQGIIRCAAWEKKEAIEQGKVKDENG